MRNHHTKLILFPKSELDIVLDRKSADGLDDEAVQSLPTKMYAHQNDRFSVFLSHQNDRSKMIGKCREMIACAEILKFPIKMIGRPAELNFPPK